MNPNTEYERFTQEVYQQLLNCRHLNNANVQHNIKLEGRSGCKHQIDVYWEYEKDGVKHRVAIECKNYNRRVYKEKVCAFNGVLIDLDGVEGIMVSKKGFQSGAKLYAKECGISLQELREPEGEETIIGNMALNFHIEKRSTLFAVDEQWAKEHNIDIPEYKRRMDMISFTHEHKWSNATHIPLELADRVIRDAEGKDIRPFVDRVLADLLRGEIAARARDGLRLVAAHDGDAEIDQLDLPVDQHEIRRFDVQMDDLLLMEEIEGLDGLVHDADLVLQWQDFVQDLVAEVMARQIFHHQIVSELDAEFRHFPQGVDADDRHLAVFIQHLGDGEFILDMAHLGAVGDVVQFFGSLSGGSEQLVPIIADRLRTEREGAADGAVKHRLRAARHHFFNFIRIVFRGGLHQLRRPQFVIAVEIAPPGQIGHEARRRGIIRFRMVLFRFRIPHDFGFVLLGCLRFHSGANDKLIPFLRIVRLVFVIF